jgi:hypothetical protein
MKAHVLVMAVVLFFEWLEAHALFRSYFSSEPQRTVKGNVVDRNGREHYVIRGTWDRYMVYHAPVRAVRFLGFHVINGVWRMGDTNTV